MLTKHLKMIAITSVTAVAIGGGVVGASYYNDVSLKSAADTEKSYSVTFSNASELGHLTTGGHEYDYAYGNTGLGNKYGVIWQTDRVSYEINYNDVREDGDLFTMKGAVRYICFSYGNIASNASYTEATFNGYITKVKINCYYTAMSDTSFYIRVLHSNDGTWSDSDSSKRLSYKPTRNEETTLEYDFVYYERVANQIRIATTNATPVVHIKSITIEYNC